MNKIILKLAVISILAGCAASQVSYDFPAQMLPHVKTEYSKRCEQGRVLYEMNCGSCHNIRKGRATIIPDFSEEKLQGYAIRISNARHEESMPDSLVTEEELVMISDFLKYKKRTGYMAHR